MTSFGVQKRNRGRASLVAVAVAAVLATGAGVAAAAAANAPAKASPAHAATVAKAVKASAGGVRTVTPGQKLTAGGDTLWLTPEGLSIVAPKSSGSDQPELVRVADVLPRKVTTVACGDASGTLWAGIYRGPVSASTKVTIKLGDRTLDAQVVTLAGKPGWGAYYVFDTHKVGADKPVITVES
ncbi:hypothetical protein ABZ865_38845 [Streptomyces sp. NPDC047085]|uniref:hypothetical protein n=1 Tax=Streptomyces sp. NPDC047085 TaxID=3155140 RepID=UPI0033DE178F